MTDWQQELLDGLPREGKEALRCLLLVIVQLAAGHAWVEHFTVLGRDYRIAGDPELNEITIRTWDH